MEPDSSIRINGTVVALVGGALVMLGSTLTWAKLAMNMPGSGSEKEVLSGMNAGDGKITLALGAIVVAVAIAGASRLVTRAGGVGTALAVLGIAAGGFASILGVMFAVDLRTHALDHAITEAGLKLTGFAQPARDLLDQATAVSSGWGLYLVILGGLVAAAGGVLAAITLRRRLAGLRMDQPEDAEELPAGDG